MHLGPLHELALAWLGRLRGAHAALHRWLEAERGAAHLARAAAACPELPRVAPEAAKLLPAAVDALRSLAAAAQAREPGTLAPRGALEVLGAAGTHEALARVAEALGPLHAAVRTALTAKRQACHVCTRWETPSSSSCSAPASAASRSCYPRCCRASSAQRTAHALAEI